MVEICKDTPYKELKGDCKTAEIHQKPISIWAVKQLNEYHGFNLKFDDAQNMYNEHQKALVSLFIAFETFQCLIDIHTLLLEHFPQGIFAFNNFDSIIENTVLNLQKFLCLIDIAMTVRTNHLNQSPERGRNNVCRFFCICNLDLAMRHCDFQI